MRRMAEENAAAEASALEAAAAAERLRIDQEIASARERRLVQVCVTTPKLQSKSGVNLRLQATMLERQYKARLLLRCRNEWLGFVGAAQQQRKDAAVVRGEAAQHRGHAVRAALRAALLLQQQGRRRGAGGAGLQAVEAPVQLERFCVARERESVGGA